VTLTGPAAITLEAGQPFTDPGATALDIVDGVLPVTISGSLDTLVPGAYTLVYASTDTRGNTGAASRVVTVVDTTAPVVAARDTVVAEATGSAGATVAYVEPPASDVVDGTVPVACQPASGSLFPLGETTVQCTAVDRAGNIGAGSFVVSVRDTTPPVVSTAPDIVAEATGAAGAVVTFGSPGATDLVSGASTAACAPSSGATFPLGATTVTCTATDASGNSASSTFTVTVRDTTPPVIAPKADVLADGTGPSGATVAYVNPTATDAVSGPRPVTCVPPSGSQFPFGATVVTCAASDAALNTATATFNVIVRDAVKPSSITATASPMVLWPPNGTLVPVTISGSAIDGQSGIAAIQYSVIDEYGEVQPSGSIPSSNGPFSFTIALLQDRRGNDKDGRRYTITAVAVDGAGNTKAAAPIVVNVHDQRKRK
jgi:hypothetical protein